MSYGFKVYNSSSFIQIDDTYRNHSLLQSGSVLCSTNRDLGGYSLVGGTVNYSRALSEVPIVLVKLESSSYFVRIARLTNSDLFFVVYNNLGNVVSGVTVQYALYTPGGATGTGNYGLNVYKSDGTVVFDGRIADKYLKLHQKISATAGKCLSITTVNYTPALSSPWIIANPTFRAYFMTYFADHYVAVRTNGTGVVQLLSTKYLNGASDATAGGGPFEVLVSGN